MRWFAIHRSGPAGCPRLAILFVPALILACDPNLAIAQAPSPSSKGDVQSVFEDFIHFARLGKFPEASAAAAKLLGHAEISPQAVLAASDRDKGSIPTLITLIKHTSLKDPAQKVLDLIHQGEQELRQEPQRIQANVDLLGGTPQAEFSAIQRLKESGEYAVPAMLTALRDPARAKSAPRVVRILHQLGKPAVSPLVAALGIEDAVIRKNLVWTLGELGYAQATPHLLKIAAAADQPEEVRNAAREALARIGDVSDQRRTDSVTSAFVRLAEQYYAEHGSVKADPRLSEANVWYWRNGNLEAVAVPTTIYGAVLAMQCCEEALRTEPASREALALWLAANIRREARLGMDVESGAADAAGDADRTRPADLPRSLFFSRAAGAEYCHLVLGRALSDGDRDVALGALAALTVVAGESTLVGSEDHKQALVRALEYPDAEVRIKAAIAVARALPKTPFPGDDRVGTVLAEALSQRGRPQYLVVDGDIQNLNRISGMLRERGADVVAETNFLSGMDRARRELQNLSAVILATDIESPGPIAAAADLRKVFRYARTPLLIVPKPQQEHRAEQLLAADQWAVRLAALADAEELNARLAEVSARTSGQPLNPELVQDLALRTAEALRLLAQDGRTVIDWTVTVPALIANLQAEQEELQVAVARVLALAGQPEAQQALAAVVLDAENPAALRLAVFDTVAESARRFGNQVTEAQIQQFVALAAADQDLALRTAATQSLGALNLRVNEASALIRKYETK